MTFRDYIKEFSGTNLKKNGNPVKYKFLGLRYGLDTKIKRPVYNSTDF